MRRFYLPCVTLAVLSLLAFAPIATNAQSSPTPVALVPNTCTRFAAGSTIHQPPASESRACRCNQCEEWPPDRVRESKPSVEDGWSAIPRTIGLAVQVQGARSGSA